MDAGRRAVELDSAPPALNYSNSNSLSAGQTLNVLLDSSRDIIGLVLALIVLIIPFIVMLNGLVMAWCARAANYREANLFMVLMQLGLPASILLTIFSLPAAVSAPGVCHSLFRDDCGDP